MKMNKKTIYATVALIAVISILSVAYAVLIVPSTIVEVTVNDVILTLVDPADVQKGSVITFVGTIVGPTTLSGIPIDLQIRTGTSPDTWGVVASGITDGSGAYSIPYTANTAGTLAFRTVATIS